MLHPEPSAWLFTVAALAVAGLHLLLILGAPIGFMTMGGRNPGVLPSSARVVSLVQALLILSLAVIVLNGARVIAVPFIPVKGWPLWLAVGISALSLIANTITPSRKERWFGMPATAALLIGSLGVALGD
jgi:predicted signal transduction protein with EAL and GGDEF domain